MIELANISESPADSFEIETEDIVRVIGEFLGSTQYDVRHYEPSDFMVWHSHPSGLVGPSKGDMEAKYEGGPAFRYVVVTLPEGQVTEY